MGWFEPTELGERLMPALTYLGPFHEEISRDVAEQSLPDGEPVSPSRRATIARRALEYKTTDEACGALADLELELRGPGGEVIPTEHISAQDTEYLLALAHDDLEPPDWEVDSLIDEPPDEFRAGMIELGLEDEPALDDDWAREVANDLAEVAAVEGEASSLPRYQVFVELVDPSGVPISDRWKDDPDVRAYLAGNGDLPD